MGSTGPSYKSYWLPIGPVRAVEYFPATRDDRRRSNTDDNPDEVPLRQDAPRSNEAAAISKAKIHTRAQRLAGRKLTHADENLAGLPKARVQIILLGDHRLPVSAGKHQVLILLRVTVTQFHPLVMCLETTNKVIQRKSLEINALLNR